MATTQASSANAAVFFDSLLGDRARAALSSAMILAPPGSLSKPAGSTSNKASNAEFTLTRN
jgi:hypothetical protein